MAETVRFELTVPLAGYDALARRWIRPLSHISNRGHVYENGGGHRIRTYGTLRYGGFQNRCNRPLCQSSAFVGDILSVFEKKDKKDHCRFLIKDSI